MPEGPITEEDIEQFKETVLAKLTLTVGKDASSATERDWSSKQNWVEPHNHEGSNIFSKPAQYAS
jgi:hypothetical protein